MLLSDFDYELPPGLIAQTPAEKRSDSRLMVLDRATRSIRNDRFASLVECFRPGDLLVLNDTRVIPARLLGSKATGGKVEIFLGRCLNDMTQEWECLSRSSKPLRPGMTIRFSEGVTGEVLAVGPNGHRLRFAAPGDVAAALERIGHMPLPPYIDRPDTASDQERYQTVYARQAGALAAPTAGLHFDEPLLRRVADAGVEILSITLHVGLGTFLPVRAESIGGHRMHAERYHVPVETAASIARAKKEGRRVIAVGTTVTRTLEATWDEAAAETTPGAGETDIFIRPGYTFRVVDALLTNFHLPKSTLLMLVSAFAGYDFIMQAYRQAIAERYRFYSYGDCMLIQ